MSNPYTPGKIGVTIKMPESKRYAADNPWFVFEGIEADEVKANIAAVFGIDTDGLTLADVVVNAQRLASSVGTASHGLGGTVLSKGSADNQKATSEAPVASSGGVWAQAQEKGADTPPWKTTSEPEVDPIIAQIEACTEIPALQQIWAENQDTFNANPAYMEAYKAKGKSLS